MRNLDRILTGAVLLIASSLGVLAVAVFFLELGKAAGREGPRGVGEFVEQRNLYVQGNWTLLPKGADALVCPVIQRDGRLAPDFRYEAGPGAWQEGVAFFLSPYALTPSRRPLVRMDYRRERSDTMPVANRESWVFAPELGLLKTDKEYKAEGWLTDEGWSTQPKVCESFRRSIGPPLALQLERASYQRYNVTHEPALAYLTAEGLYRADLQALKIQRVASISGPVLTFPGTGATSNYARAYLLTRDRIHWIDPIPRGSYGSMELPARLSGRDDLQVAAGTEDRVIVREERGRTAEAVAYHVTVLSGRGEPALEYDYSFPMGRKVPESAQAVEAPDAWDVILGRTNGGILCQAVIPPAWRAALIFQVRRMKHWQEMALGLDVDRQMFQGPFWIGLPLPIVLAVLVGRRARKESKGWLAPSLWALFVLGFGLPAALTYWLLGRREAGVEGKPKMLGIEILRPV